VEQLAGFDEHVKLKDIDLQKMDISASDPAVSASDSGKSTYDGLLDEDSLALFGEESQLQCSAMESQNFFV